MTNCKSLALALVVGLSGCGGPLGKWELQRDSVAEVNTGARRGSETITKNGVQFQIECSSAHPAICWAVGPNRLAALLRDAADVINYGDIHTLEDDRYVFRKECEGVSIGGDPRFGLTEHQATFRVFEYRDKETIYIFRDVDMNGRKFRNFIVVASMKKPAGNYYHSVIQRTNEIGEVKYCREAESSR